MSLLPQGVSLAIRVVAGEIKQLQKRKLIIALDGHSSSGKSTLAKDLSRLLEITHVDSGAMYRAVTWYLIDHQIEMTDFAGIQDALSHIHIDFTSEEGKNITVLNGLPVEDQIRSVEVSEMVSEVSTLSIVRSFLVTEQRKLANAKGVIMDGRDIGTVVFPEADVKLFVTAAMDVRTSRRYEELKSKGIDISIVDVRKNLIKRDLIDSSRSDSPLRQAHDAVHLDTTHLDRGEMLTQTVQIIFKKIKGKSL